MSRLDKILSILGDSSKQRFRESYFEKNYNSLYQEIIEYTKTLDIEKFPQRVWHWVYDLNIQHLCKTCNTKTTTFNKNWLDGYRDFCSPKCSAVSTSTKDKRKETCLEIYGVDNVAKNENIKSKTENTNIERYGFKSTFQNEIVRDKWKETILKKYGTDHYSKTIEFKIKYKKTIYNNWNDTHFSKTEIYRDKIREKWGVDNIAKSDEIKTRTKIRNNKKFGSDYYLQSDSFKKNILERFGVEHAIQSDIIKDKIKETNIERYGCENSSNSDIVKNKTKQTNIERYGCEYPTQSDTIKDKIKNTNIERYGVDNIMKSNTMKDYFFQKYGYEYPIQSDIIKDKIKKSNIEKYGVDNIMKSEVGVEKIKIHNNKKYHTYYNDLLENNSEYSFIDYSDGILSLKHSVCNNIFDINSQNFYDRSKNNINICTSCHPISENKSIKEKEIITWLKTLDINFTESDRSILDNKELDIFIESKKLAIEFNGLYWHSEFFKDKTYHLNKSLECTKKDIQLLHIWEDEWVFKQDIVKSIIQNKLGIIDEKIYARQCDIGIVNDSKLVRKFLDDNHIQGYSQSSLKLGLFKDGELVSLMTFGYRHTNSKKEYELIRFCNKKFVNVIGAASKLFKFFKQNYSFEELISYSDFRLFDGEMYKTLGFSKQHLSKPDYFWCKNLERRHRFNFNKKLLIREGYDASKTEVEIMHERGYFRIYGCGQYKWVIKK